MAKICPRCSESIIRTKPLCARCATAIAAKKFRSYSTMLEHGQETAHHNRVFLGRAQFDRETDRANVEQPSIARVKWLDRPDP
jgi:predicted amidophosphoribosyltransferase